MADSPPEVRDLPEQGWDRGFDGHKRRQAVMGLRLTYVERLEWLDQTMRELRKLQGAASGKKMESR